jgi:predicted Co/Zn/Cd cation transporter (cation efflux family)
MHDIEAKGREEAALLRFSVRLLIGLALLSVGFGILTGSFAILFDGIYAVIDAAMGGLALLVSRLIVEDAVRKDEERPDRTRRYQFGFWHLEPMVLALNATLLMLAVVYALGGALLLLWEGGSEPDFGWAVVYAAGMAIVCFAMAWRQGRRNSALGSGFIALDVKSWKMSGAVSSALLGAFALGWMMTGTRFEAWQPFVDPAILALICLVILPMPFSDLRAAVADIFLIAPEELDRHVRRVAAETVARHGLADAYTYVARVGRSMLIDIHFQTPPGWPIGGVATLDAIRDEVGAALGNEGPGRWLTICFTEDADWAL